ncbi:F-box protein [Senna tora]|uniref:F-box protein n=1 Tax=Senna tora TaxID=362788 RepID=A0A834T4D8_9FABA|nr:F-box protein [Senna tora]
MRTRRGLCYPRVIASSSSRMTSEKEMVRNNQEYESSISRKRLRKSPENTAGVRVGVGGCNFLESLPDDLVLLILAKLGSSASSPSDFISALITCKRLHDLGLQSQVLSKASPKTFSVRAKNWSDSAHRFLKQCADSGNVEACYTLGMIRFYCLQNRGSGASLMAKAAINSHAPALYSLAVIQFNGSGGTKNDKDLRAGVALCARAAFLGHIDALRELGHCLQDGYGVRQNITEGRRFLVQANARELAAVLSSAASTSGVPVLTWNLHPVPHPHPHPQLRHLTGSGCPLLSDYGCNVPAPESHPANRFMTEWFGSNGGSTGSGLRLCSHVGCGRPETRKHEFRRCSVCGTVNYCSRACQALDWKFRHKAECVPVERWANEEGDEAAGENDDGGGNGDGEMAVDS